VCDYGHREVCVSHSVCIPAVVVVFFLLHPWDLVKLLTKSLTKSLMEPYRHVAPWLCILAAICGILAHYLQTSELRSDKSGELLKGTREWHWAQVVWDYHKMGHKVSKADGILVLCSHDLRVADRAVQLYQQGLGNWVVFSGGFGTGPHSGANLNGWTRPEAEIFAEAAIASGIPKEVVLIENEATNTGENIAFSRRLLAQHKNIHPSKLIIVQKPFMERRSFATVMRQWGEGAIPQIQLSSPEISFDDYPNSHLSRETLVNIMVGDLQRIKLYASPAKDFQIPQDIPADVWAAYEGLVSAGFSWNVIQE